MIYSFVFGIVFCAVFTKFYKETKDFVKESKKKENKTKIYNYQISNKKIFEIKVD